MRKRSKKPSVAKTDDVSIYISPIMFVMAVYFTAMGMAFEFVCSIAAVLLHELAHARVAKKLGYGLNMIKLMPYGAALCGAEYIKPKHEIMIAAAGPMFNLVLAAPIAALWWLYPPSYAFTKAFCLGNLYVGIFNLLPVYPLDGGRIALALLSTRTGRGKAYKIMRIVSAAVGVAAIVLFGVSFMYTPDICLLSVGIFMTASALLPDDRAKYTALFAVSERAQKLKTPHEVRRYAVTADASAASLVSALDPDVYTEFTVLDENGLNKLRTVTETELTRFAEKSGYTATAGELARGRTSKPNN